MPVRRAGRLCGALHTQPARGADHRRRHHLELSFDIEFGLGPECNE